MPVPHLDGPSVATSSCPKVDDALCRVLAKLAAARRSQAERLLSEAQALESAQPAPGGRGASHPANALLALYLDSGSAADAARRACELGLLMQGSKGPRQPQPADVFRTLTAPEAGVLPGLLAAALERYARNGGFTCLPAPSRRRAASDEGGHCHA